jgi:hypothetical protein
MGQTRLWSLFHVYLLFMIAMPSSIWVLLNLLRDRSTFKCIMILSMPADVIDQVTVVNLKTRIKTLSSTMVKLSRGTHG